MTFHSLVAPSGLQMPTAGRSKLYRVNAWVDPMSPDLAHASTSACPKAVAWLTAGARCAQVRYLKVIEKSGYQALPWVRYITTGGEYEARAAP